MPFRGDIYFASLDPIRDSEQAGTRPVIIVSRDAINQNSAVVICVPCTNAAHSTKIYPSQIVLKRGVGGLKVDSVALCEQIRAVSIARLGDQLGKLDRQSLKAVEERIKIALDLD